MPRKKRKAPTSPVERGPRWTEYLPVDDLQEEPRNPKRHHDDLGASIGRFGYADGVILDERTGRLVAGHGRRAELVRMRDAGQEPPDGVQVGADGAWLVPVQRGWASRSDAEAEAFLVAHNRVGEAGGWDDAELGALLADLHAGDVPLDGLGMSQAEFESLASATPAFSPTDEADQHGLDSLSPKLCPHCGKDTREPPAAH